MDRLGVHHLTYAKISHFDLALLGQENVGCLEVSVREVGSGGLYKH